VALAWSGGKDSSLALAHLLADPAVEVAELLTTVTRDFDRVSMHGVRRGLVRAQAAALGLPLREVEIAAGASNAEYEAAFGVALSRLRGEGVLALAFGDLFLADVRAYRERQLAASDVAPWFPLWGSPTAALARRFIAEGYRARFVCVDPRHLDFSWAGRAYDAAAVAGLPAGVDPCGENGEFHTFVWDGPIFRCPVPFIVGERVERDGFWFCDLLPADVSP
jgi:uncharacterized protein (TIGR00290 family)